MSRQILSQGKKENLDNTITEGEIYTFLLREKCRYHSLSVYMSR